MIHVLDNIPIITTPEQVVDRLRVEEEEDVQLVTELFNKAREIARPKALYRETFVQKIEGRDVFIDGFHFQSDVLAMNLKSVHRVFAYVCTCGSEVDDWSHKEKDYVVSVWLDMIKQMFLLDAITFLREHLKNAFQIEKLSTINPGSGDVENWPLSQQRSLFAMINDVNEKIGVTLTESFLMVPTKSSSGLFFPSDIAFVNCTLCSRANCPGRSAEFDGKMYARAFS